MNPVKDRIGTNYGVPGDMWAAGHHTGVDFLSPTGTKAVAPFKSKIVYAGGPYGPGSWGSAYGNHVIGEVVVNGVTYRWIMAHLKSDLVSVGQIVQAGQEVAYTNNTGNTSGPHLHFEVRHGPYRYGDDVNPTILTAAAPALPKPKPGTVTDIRVSSWNLASPRWYTPWAPRASEISKELIGEADVYFFQECYSEEQANTIARALGPNFMRISGAAGLEIWYDKTKFQLERAVYKASDRGYGYPSGVQDRYALVVHLQSLLTGQHFAAVNFHGPVTYDSLKTKYGVWLAKLLSQIDGPIILGGDANRSAEDKSPRKEIRALGFRDMRDQASIQNASLKEFPSKGWNLADFWTDLNDQFNDKIIGGEIDASTTSFESDHRRIEVTVRIVAA